MGERVIESRDSLRLYLLTAFLSALAGVVLFLQDWTFPVSVQPQYWNGLVAFSVLAVLCDSSFLPISRITSANVRSSVAFIPLLASVVLFQHPWPMLMSGLAALVVDAFVRHRRGEPGAPLGARVSGNRAHSGLIPPSSTMDL